MAGSSPVLTTKRKNSLIKTRWTIKLIVKYVKIDLVFSFLLYGVALWRDVCKRTHDEGVSVEARIRHLWFESPQRYKNNDSLYPISPFRRYRVKWSECCFTETTLQGRIREILQDFFLNISVIG